MPLTNVDLDRIDGNSGLLANVSTSALNGGPLAGTRNRIINGDMRIDQRNAGASVTIGATTSVYTLDRWACQSSVASKYSIQQNAGAVTPPAGFTNYVGITSLSAYSSTAGDYFTFYQVIEGFNTADFAWGTASAQTVTASFWVRSSLTGTHSASICNSDGTRSYPFTYTVNSANTWEYKSITIPGLTSGTWQTGNGAGAAIRFDLGCGSNFRGAAGSWSSSNLIGVTGAVSVVGTNGATFYLTGVQLEAGTVATPFERRPYGAELALAQRYYLTIGEILGSGLANTINTAITWQYRQSMRAQPSVSFTSGYGTVNGVFPSTTACTFLGTSDATARLGVGSATASAEL